MSAQMNKHWQAQQAAREFFTAPSGKHGTCPQCGESVLRRNGIKSGQAGLLTYNLEDGKPHKFSCTRSRRKNVAA